MCRCSKCKFCEGDIIFESEPGIKYWWCGATMNCVDYEAGEDETLGCEFYVNELDVDNPEA